MKNFVAFFSGVVFAIGLVVSGMTDPGKVLGFLDVAGVWDASLAFVMAGAVCVNLLTFRWALARKPAFAREHSLPGKSTLDLNLIFGAIIFGVGWGLIGICPGPALVNLVTFKADAFYFVGAMLLGMQLFRYTGLSRN